MKKGTLFLVFCFSLSLFYIQNLFSSGAPQKEQLIYLSAQEAQTLDPARAQDYFSARIIAHIYEGLVRFKPDTWEVEPCLATGWEVSKDGLSWTFKLRPGVTFHDGTPFDASAVKFNVDRQKNKGGALTYADLVYGMVESVEVVDDLTVRFRLKFPYAPFLNNLALPFVAPVVSPAAIKKYGDGVAGHPSGTGPFRFEKWKRNTEIRLKANPDYWGKKPAVQKVVWRTEKSASRRINLMANERADLVDVSAEDAAVLTQKQKGTAVWRAPGVDISYLGFYTNKKPFANPQVRRAACLAVNQSKIIAELFRQNGVPASAPLPPGILGYSPDLRQPLHNPQQARRLLAAAGYPDGLSIKLITYAQARPYNPAGGEKLARELADHLAAAGFRVEIAVYPWEEFKKALLRQEGDAFLYGWTADNGDPDNFLYTLFSSSKITAGLNASRYRNQRVDTLLATAQRITDQAVRARLYQDVQKQLLQDMPVYYINHSLFLIAASRHIQDFKIRPGGYFYLQDVQKRD